MFRDPCDDFPFHQLRHLVGNVGKPAVALLMSGQHLEVSEVDNEDLHEVNLRPFNGIYEDNFGKTSVHIWLTGYEMALPTEHHGARDKQAIYVEAITSAYEGGKKVADLDFLKIMNDVQLPVSPDSSILKRPQLNFLPSKCDHAQSAKSDTSFFGEITMLDNWFEVLDLPSNSAIIRARGNWLARLSLTARCLQQQRDLVIFPETNICWACAKESLNIVDEDADDQFLFLC